MKKNHIYTVELDPTIGYEMNKLRPCLIISPNDMNEYLKTVIIAPLTTIKRDLPTRIKCSKTELSGLNEISYIALDQLKTIDKSRLIKKIGVISTHESQEVTESLQQLFS